MDDAITTCRSCEREIDDALTWCPYCGTEQHPESGADDPTAGEAADPQDTAEAGPAAGTGGPGTLDTRATILALVAILLIGAVSAWFFFIRDDNRGAISLLDVGPGDCWVEPSAETVSDAINTVPEVPCDEPHAFEVFAVSTLEGESGAAYPLDTIGAAADRECREQLGSYTGVSYIDSPLGVWPLYPTEASWGEGDREVVCSLFAIDGTELTSSQRDAGERLASPAVDAAGIDTCPALAQATLPIAQAFVDYVDEQFGQDEAPDPGDLPAELVAAYKSELLLATRADELGCTPAELNAHFGELATSLTSRTDSGRAVIDDYIANGYFAAG